MSENCSSLQMISAYLTLNESVSCLKKYLHVLRFLQHHIEFYPLRDFCNFLYGVMCLWGTASNSVFNQFSNSKKKEAEEGRIPHKNRSMIKSSTEEVTEMVMTDWYYNRRYMTILYFYEKRTNANNNSYQIYEISLLFSSFYLLLYGSKYIIVYPRVKICALGNFGRCSK